MKEKRKLKKISIIINIVILIILFGSIAYGITELKTDFVWYPAEYQNTTTAALYELYRLANSNVNASTIANNTANIGKIVKGYKPYTRATGGTSDEWQIMYADDSHVYIITRYKVYNTIGPDLSLSPAGASDGSLRIYYQYGDYRFKYYRAVNMGGGPAYGWFNKYMVSNLHRDGGNYDPNMCAVSYMLDNGVWNAYYGVPGKSAWVIGSPTMEMLCKSYDTVKGVGPVTYNALDVTNQYGYNESRFVITPNPDERLLHGYWWNNGESYWLACPSNFTGNGDAWDRVRFFNRAYAAVPCTPYYTDDLGFRPVVCLNTGVQLRWDESTQAFWVK